MKKTALVTGSPKRLGKAILLALAEKEYTVIVHYNKSKRDALKTVQLAKKFGVNAFSYKADLTIESEVKSLFKKIKKKFGKLDVLVNNVGNFGKKPVRKYSLKEWNSLIEGGVSSAFVCCKYAIPIMRKNGRIINIGDSEASTISSHPRIVPYKIGKIGVNVLTKTLALELAKKKITVNMVSPGVMFNAVSFPPGGLKNVPLKRWTKNEDVINAVLFLLKEESNYITGANIAVDGGFGV